MKNLATRNAKDYLITEQGEVFISQRKTAELCGMSRNAIRNYFKNENVTRGITPEQLYLVVRYYDNKESPEAKVTMDKFGAAGAKAFIYHEAGYTVTATNSISSLDTHIKAVEAYLNLLKREEALKAELEIKRIQLDESMEWFSIKRIAKENNVYWNTLKWRLLKKAPSAPPPKKVFGANFPSGVNVYHRKAWEEIYPELKLPTDNSKLSNF